MGFFTRAKDSFTNFEMYTEAAFEKKSQSLKYFMLLFTVVFILGSLRMAYDFNLRITDMSQTASEKIPEFNFSNGVLEVKGPQPVVLEGDNETVIMIDTTGKTDESALDGYNEGVYISRHKLVTKQNFQSREIKFSNFKNTTVDKDKLIRFLPMLKWVMLPVGAVLYFFATVWALITTALLAAVGTFMVRRQLRDKIGFTNLWNISVYAMTLPWLMDTIKNLVYPALPFFFIIKWGVALIILNKAVEAVNDRLSDNNQPPGEAVV